MITEPGISPRPGTRIRISLLWILAATVVFIAARLMIWQYLAVPVIGQSLPESSFDELTVVVGAFLFLGLSFGLAVLFHRRSVRALASQHQQHLEAVKKAGDLYRTLIDRSPDGVLIHREGRVSFVNNTLCALVKATSDKELVGRPILDFVVENYHEVVLDRIRRRLVGDDDLAPAEIQLRCCDGTLSDVEITSTNLTSTMGFEALVYVRDVSYRVAAERALRESQHSLNMLMENLPGMAFRMQYKPTRQLDFVSGGSELLLGLTPSALLDHINSGKALLTHADDLAAVEDALRSSGETGDPLTMEFRIRHQNGSYCWVWLHAIPTLVNDPPRVFFDGIILDTDSRHQLEQQYSLLWAAVKAADEGIVITDADGTIEYVNPSFIRMAGYEPEEAIGRKPSILKSGKQDDAFYRNLWTTIRSGRTWSGVIINKRKDGTLYDEFVTISPVHDQSGSINHFVAVKRDITHQRALEQQLLQSQKLEAVGLLAGGIAHDFNNMLTAILGYGYLLSKQLPADDRRQEDIGQITATAERAAALTKQLLAYSRKQASVPVRVDINATLTNLQRMLSRIIGENIDLVPDFGDSLDPVLIDPSQLEQVVLNLVVNARDAMPEGGQIMLSTRMRTLRSADLTDMPSLEPGQYVQLICTDTGCGMSSETVARMFDPFFTTKEQGKGTGLGLSMVYGIIQQAHGHISAVSSPGQGTTFTILLPAAGTVEQDSGLAIQGNRATCML